MTDCVKCGGPDAGAASIVVDAGSNIHSSFMRSLFGWTVTHAGVAPTATTY